jgi:hypothetical protein
VPDSLVPQVTCTRSELVGGVLHQDCTTTNAQHNTHSDVIRNLNADDAPNRGRARAPAVSTVLHITARAGDCNHSRVSTPHSLLAKM